LSDGTLPLKLAPAAVRLTQTSRPKKTAASRRGNLGSHHQVQISLSPTLLHFELTTRALDSSLHSLLTLSIAGNLELFLTIAIVSPRGPALNRGALLRRLTTTSTRHHAICEERQQLSDKDMELHQSSDLEWSD
jgi:hypothetical protein